MLHPSTCRGFLLFVTRFVFPSALTWPIFHHFLFYIRFTFKYHFISFTYAHVCFFLLPPFCALLMHTQLQSHYFSISFSTSRPNLMPSPTVSATTDHVRQMSHIEHLILCNWKHWFKPFFRSVDRISCLKFCSPDTTLCRASQTKKPNDWEFIFMFSRSRFRLQASE